MHEYHFWLESDYGAPFGMIEAQNEEGVLQNSQGRL